jgi:hypothetical protein
MLKQIKISIYLNISTHRTVGIESMRTGKNNAILKVTNKWPGAAQMCFAVMEHEMSQRNIK